MATKEISQKELIQEIVRLFSSIKSNPTLPEGLVKTLQELLEQEKVKTSLGEIFEALIEIWRAQFANDLASLELKTSLCNLRVHAEK